MAFSYANTGSGPSAGGIGWFDFGNFTIVPGQTVQNLTGTLANGITVTFDVTLSFLGGSPRNFTAVSAPIPTAYFGSAGYTGLTGNVVLYSDAGTANNLSNLIFSNIVVKDALGNPMPNYTVILADGENTSGVPNFQEGLTFTTNGGNWAQLAALGNTNPPQIFGAGQFVGFIGVSAPPNTAYVYSTQSPTQVVASLEEALANTRQGVAIGFAATQVEVYKNIAGRRYPADQFALAITGGPNAQVNTVGASNGLQGAYATVAAIPGTTYTLDETMAPGSVSTLADYRQTVTAVNLTPGGTTPIVGPLPESVSPILGDIIQYTILNQPNPVSTKTVDKSYAKPGDLLTYTVTVSNPDTTAAINSILVTDATPAGTTYMGNLIVSGPYTGIDPESGITITSIAAGSSVTLSWQVQVNGTIPVINPISNVAVVTTPGIGTSTTNAVTTQVNSADLISPGNFLKTASPAFARPGDTVTYTIQVTNSGNVPANNVILTDPLPTGATYLPGSVTGTVPFTGTPATTIKLTGPLAAGATAAFTFQAVIGNAVPTPNPMLNTASINYTYTVDPAVPNGASGSGTSNTASVSVNSASLTVIKSANPTTAYLGSTITYQIAVTNTGNVPADNVVITDPVPSGTVFVAGSLIVNVPFTGSPATSVSLTNPIAPGQTVTLSFQVKVTGIPNPNPIKNVASAAFTYTVDPAEPDGAAGSVSSNTTSTVVFKNNFGQEVNDLIGSVALQEAALANIQNAEAAKIQRVVAMGTSTPSQLLCFNKSVNETLEATALLQSVLKQKLNTVDCQINSACT